MGSKSFLWLRCPVFCILLLLQNILRQQSIADLKQARARLFQKMKFSVVRVLFLLSVFPSVSRVYTESLPGILFPHLTQGPTWHRHNAGVTLIVILAPTSDPALIVTFKLFSTRALSGPMSAQCRCYIMGRAGEGVGSVLCTVTVGI